MKTKFKISFLDVWEAEDEASVIEELIKYLSECSHYGDITAFDVTEVCNG